MKVNKATQILLGNESIARGALEAELQFAAGYPGTPSSEIVHTLSQEAKILEGLHVEWSTNEKVATEVAAAAALAGLRSLSAMKNAGLSVALDFLSHLALTGLGNEGGAMVVVVCDDPAAHSSGDETDSRWLAKFASVPLVEPSSVQEAKLMTTWAFDLSEKFNCCVILRSYTRLSHASSEVELIDIPYRKRQAFTDNSQCLSPYLAKPKHMSVINQLEQVRETFEISNFNEYSGCDHPDLLVVCSGSGSPCSSEAVELLHLESTVGILKLGTIWPFPERLVAEHLRKAERILIVEEVDGFIESHVKDTIVEFNVGGTKVFGKKSGHIPSYGEISVDLVCNAFADLFSIDYQPRTIEYEKCASAETDGLIIDRELTWCAGCPHRASFWALEKAVKTQNKNTYVTGDIGCYCLDVFPGGKRQINVLHGMGSGSGLAAGFGQLGTYEYNQRVISICGDSTFFHASIPALINAVYNKSNMVQIILDNGATAMTGLQPHAGTGFNAIGEQAEKINIEDLCRAIGCEVAVIDPFDIKGTLKKMREALREKEGVKVLILRRTCQLLQTKEDTNKEFLFKIIEEKCKGEACSICWKNFRCPAFVPELTSGKVRIKRDICSKCGVCIDICPFNAIVCEKV